MQLLGLKGAELSDCFRELKAGITMPIQGKRQSVIEEIFVEAGNAPPTWKADK